MIYDSSQMGKPAMHVETVRGGKIMITAYDKLVRELKQPHRKVLNPNLAGGPVEMLTC